MSVLERKVSVLKFCHKDGVKPDMDVVEVMRAMPDLKTLKQVKGFTGVIHYSRFIPAFSRLAASLLQVTKKYARFK